MELLQVYYNEYFVPYDSSSTAELSKKEIKVSVDILCSLKVGYDMKCLQFNTF